MDFIAKPTACACVYLSQAQQVSSTAEQCLLVTMAAHHCKNALSCVKFPRDYPGLGHLACLELTQSLLLQGFKVLTYTKRKYLDTIEIFFILQL